MADSNNTKTEYLEGDRPSNHAQLGWALRDSRVMKTLKPGEFNFLWYLCSRSQRCKDGEWRVRYTTRELIVKDTDIKERSQQNYTKALVKAGLLYVVIGGEGVPNTYTIISAKLYTLAKETIATKKKKKDDAEAQQRKEIAELSGVEVQDEVEVTTEPIVEAAKAPDDAPIEKPEPAEKPTWNESIDPDTMFPAKDYTRFNDKGMHMTLACFLLHMFGGVDEVKYGTVLAAAKLLHQHSITEGSLFQKDLDTETNTPSGALAYNVFEWALNCKDPFWRDAAKKSRKDLNHCPVAFLLAKYEEIRRQALPTLLADAKKSGVPLIVEPETESEDDDSEAA